MPTVVRFHQFGGPENLRFEAVPTQRPGLGEVRLRVQAVGLNRAESLYYRGSYRETAELPSRIGYEAAGVVVDVGEGVDPGWVGKTAATVPGFSQSRYGTLGEEAVVPEGVLGTYPATLMPTQAAAIWMAYLTAYGALVRIGGVTSGDFVSIPAASSSVGLAAIQTVRDAGATAIAVTRTAAKRAELLALGAHHVIVSQDEDYVERIEKISGGRGARLTFDPVGGPFVEKLVEATTPGGIVFEYGTLSGQSTPFPLWAALRRSVSMRGYSLTEFALEPKVAPSASTFAIGWSMDASYRRSRGYSRSGRLSRHTDISSPTSRSGRSSSRFHSNSNAAAAASRMDGQAVRQQPRGKFDGAVVSRKAGDLAQSLTERVLNDQIHAAEPGSVRGSHDRAWAHRSRE